MASPLHRIEDGCPNSMSYKALRRRHLCMALVSASTVAVY